MSGEESVNVDGLDVEKQSFECRSPPAKFSQPWASDHVASLKEQFSEISNGLIDIKKSVRKDIKDWNAC